MKHFILTSALALSCLGLHAQSEEGIRYALPMTAMHFTVTFEKTVYTPGEYAEYTRRFLRKDVSLQPQTTYRILDIKMVPKAVIDTSKQFTLLLDKKRSITTVDRTADGRLLAINTTNPAAKNADDALACNTVTLSGQHAAPLNPRDYMTEDILRAGSTAKMAELSAQEIYDIRDSRNTLSRGEADNLPKDGTQLRMMYNHLDLQEQALTQLFEGITVKDTLATSFDFIPRKEGKTVLFRFGKQLGLVGSDDLGGEPYYLTIVDTHKGVTPAPVAEEDKKKEDKNDIGLRTALPGKATATLSSLNGTVDSYELLLPQFGTVENLSGELFGKKLSAQLILDPITGAVISVEQFTPDNK